MASPRKRPPERRDATGHLNPGYEWKLLAPFRARRDAGDDKSAFVSGTRTHERLAEERAEAFIESALSDEDVEGNRRDRITIGELGGPFVPSSGKREFAYDVEPPNIPEAMRESWPRTSAAVP